MIQFQPSDKIVKSTSSLPVFSPCVNSSDFSAMGTLQIPMTNDYLFRALLQQNNKALIGLTASLLHVEPAVISSAQIMNPIELGKAVDHKTFILDIKVSINNNVRLNLEMQVINEHNWLDRSLCYLCRNFDQLSPGEEYQMVHPVIQIGILNFTLFPEHPEFFATYKFLNVKNHTLYSDKLRLSVLDLTQIKLATKEDKNYQLDNWASFFRTSTWEEITMLTKNNEYISEAANTIYQLTQDERIRMQCEAREDYYRTQRGWQRMIKEQENLLREQQNLLTEQKGLLEEKNTIIQEQKNEYENLLAWAKKHGYENGEETDPLN